MAPSVWICDECTFKNDGSKPGLCLMCQAPQPKCRAVASVPAPCAAPPNNDKHSDDAFSKSMSDEVTSLLSPCTAPPNDNHDDDDAFSKIVSDVDSPRAEGLVIDIAGIALGDRGCRCKEHKVCCGEVVDVDIVVRLRCKEILVPDDFLSKGNMREETAITVNWVTNGFEQCHVGFLPLSYVPNAAVYDGARCQVIEVFDKDESSCANWAKWKPHNGFARTMVISKLNGKIVHKVKGMEVKVALVKGNYSA
jgi:hypothetical protein